MATEDLPAVGVWLTAIGAMVWLAWEPWRQTRHLVSIEVPSGGRSQSVTPLYIFLPAVFAAAGPFMAQLAPRPGVNVWLHPHLIMPFGLIELGGLCAIQLVLRVSVLRYAERRRQELSARRGVFDNAP